MLRIILGTAAVSLILLTACDDGNDRAPTATATASATPHNGAPTAPVTPVPRPEMVPETARPIGQTTTLGRIVRHANEPPQTVAVRGLLDAFCNDDVLILQTSQETVYAPLPCTRFWDADSAATFLGEPVAIRLEVTGTRFRILVETVAGAQAEFTVTGLWVQ